MKKLLLSLGFIGSLIANAPAHSQTQRFIVSSEEERDHAAVAELALSVVCQAQYTVQAHLHVETAASLSNAASQTDVESDITALANIATSQMKIAALLAKKIDHISELQKKVLIPAVVADGVMDAQSAQSQLTSVLASTVEEINEVIHSPDVDLTGMVKINQILQQRIKKCDEDIAKTEADHSL